MWIYAYKIMDPDSRTSYDISWASENHAEHIDIYLLPVDLTDNINKFNDCTLPEDNIVKWNCTEPLPCLHMFNMLNDETKLCGCYI